MRYTPPAAMQYRPNARKVRNKRVGLSRFWEKKRAAKRNAFLIHSRGRVDTSKRESIDSGVWVCAGVSPLVCCAPEAWTFGITLCEKSGIDRPQGTCALRFTSPERTSVSSK